MIRLLTETDVPAAVALLERVDLANGAANVARYLRWQPDGCWGWFDGTAPPFGGAAVGASPAVEDRALVGTVVVQRHDHVGFVGCMAVEPSRQGRGIGRALLEHAQLASRRGGVTTFLLEATPRGQVLYESLGYTVDYDTVIASRAGVAECAARPLAAERAAIMALDRAATGSEREPMIGSLVDEFSGTVIHAGTRLAGYGLVSGTRLGPVIASDPGAGRAIVDALAPACTGASVPVPNEHAMAAVSANGFAVVRTLRRMRLGPAVAVRVAWIWTLASPGAG